MPRIALVEDDASISELVRYNLQQDGFDVDVHPDGESLLSVLAGVPTPPFDLFLLDVMLPGIDGFDVLEGLRGSPRTAGTPVLMLTARGSESDKVRGLESGADDYLVKPFGIRELLARVHALLRRGASSAAQESLLSSASAGSEPSGILHGYGGVGIDDARHRVFRNHVEVVLTHREYELLLHLLRNSGIAFSRDDLLRRVWGFDFAGETRTVDVHVRQLRLKLADTDPSDPLIETVRGRGYRYRETRS